VEHHGTGWTAIEGSGAHGADRPVPGNLLGVVMFDQVPPASDDDPIVLRPSAGVAWVWAVLAAFFGFALIRGYLGAATTGGRIGVVIFMGACIALAGWAAVYMVTHRPAMSISASQITWAKATTARTRAADPQILVLDHSGGKDLKLLTASRGTAHTRTA
jgi:hypothetical protein